jgi:hypothetical protein
MDPVTVLAVITLLFMMLQTEHERCDRVRAGWREVRRATLASTSALQWAKKKQGQPDAAEYLEKAQASLQDMYAILLLHGKGSLREEYRAKLNQFMTTKVEGTKVNAMGLLPVFAALDGRAERKFDTWKLRIL